MSQHQKFGIDHPLVAVKHIDKAAEQFAKIGFFINPRHHHPWGTDNHLLMFPKNFVELISVYDDTKLDLKNDNGFAFGRFVSNAIESREGIALVALNSLDARADYKYLEEQKVENDGIVDFRRVAHRPDGSEEEAIVSLVMLVDSKTPRLSNFLCHQHKPDLVWVDDWMHHPNKANAITKVTYIVKDLEAAKKRYTSIYGADAITDIEDAFVVATSSGVFEFFTLESSAKRFAEGELDITESELPQGVSITISTADIKAAENILIENSIEYTKQESGTLRLPSHVVGNTIFEFEQSKD